MISLSPAAREKVASILCQTPHKPHFRVQIKGGGCSGFEYVFGIDDTIRDNDFHESINNVSSPFLVLVDAISHQYIGNASVDFVSDAKGERFVVTNPNAETSCSCGSSFSAKPSGDN